MKDHGIQVVQLAKTEKNCAAVADGLVIESVADVVAWLVENAEYEFSITLLGAYSPPPGDAINLIFINNNLHDEKHYKKFGLNAVYRTASIRGVTEGMYYTGTSSPDIDMWLNKVSTTDKIVKCLRDMSRCFSEDLYKVLTKLSGMRVNRSIGTVRRIRVSGSSLDEQAINRQHAERIRSELSRVVMPPIRIVRKPR